ncbi:MAG: homocysteine S-methyltransferase family protein [Alistipes sp.]
MTEGVERALRESILLLDGGLATALPLSAEQKSAGCESLVLTAPETIRALHADYIDAGADIITTDSFLSDSRSLARYGLANRSFDISARAAELACEAVAESHRRCFVFGALHPVGSDCHSRQIEGLIAGGADAILLESICNTLHLVDIVRLIRRCSSWIPIAASATATHLPDAEAFYRALPATEMLAVGYNCSDGVESIAEQAAVLGRIAQCATIFYPNTGKNGMTPAEFADGLERYLQQGLCNAVGGCCGTTPKHTAALREKTNRYSPRRF